MNEDGERDSASEFVDPFGKSGEPQASKPADRKGGYSEAEVERMNRVPPTEKPELRTKSGKVLSEDEIQALADEAERGYDIEQFVPRASDANPEEGRKESYSKRLEREGGAVASGKFAEDENPEPEDPHLGEEPVTPTKELVEEELPDDIKAIWGHAPEDIKTAKHLIGAWGLDAFRGSQLHLAALQEARSAKQRTATQKAFLDAQKRLKK